MKLLAFETSSAVGSVALAEADRIMEATIESPREQTEQLLPLAQQLLSAAGMRLADLDGIAFGRGPGSFTGLRIAAAAAQGLALATELPLLPVSSLAATAQGLWRTEGATRVLVCVDAHMGEVFWGRYDIRDGLAQLVGAERLSSPLEVSDAGLEAWTAAGNGFMVYESELSSLVAGAQRVFPAAGPRATDLMPLAVADLAAGRGRRPEDALPSYLRSAAAWRK